MTWTKDDAADYQREWRKRNPEKVSGYKKTVQERRAADKAALDPRAYRQKYFRELHRDKIRQQGFECDLTADDLDWPDVCPVSGLPLNYADGQIVLERIDPSQGYVAGNVRFVRPGAHWFAEFRRRYPGLV